MDDLVLKFAKSTFEIVSIFGGEPAIQSLHHFLPNRSALGFQVFHKASDERSIASPRPVAEESAGFVLDNGLGRGNVLASVLQRLLAPIGPLPS